MKQLAVALSSLVMLALFMAALVLNLAPQATGTPFEVVRSNVEGSQP